MSRRASSGSRENGRYSALVRGTSIIGQEPKRNLAASLDSPPSHTTYSRSSDRHTSNSLSCATEQFKFLSGTYEQIQIRSNYSVVEAFQPTPNFVYLARSLSYGKSFCVSVTKVVNEEHSDFSFIIGFTSCSPTLISKNKQHFTVQCCPTGCGGHSQQLKIFNANQVGTKVTVERQLDGQIYFAIGSSMPIRIQFDRNSCGINLVKEEFLTPYIQLSGNAIALMAATNVRKLNIRSAVSLGTATAYGPPIHKQKTLAIDIVEAHQAFVASSDVDNKFIALKYPQSDVKVTPNRMAVLRKNERGEKSVFYIDKMLNINARVTIQVTKTYDADKYTSDFEFGVMTVHSDYMKMLEGEFFMDSLSAAVRNATQCFKIQLNSKVNDKYSFTRTGSDVIEIKKNDVVHKMWKIDKKFTRTKNLLPLVILNGSVSGLLIVNNETSIKFGQTYEWPALDIKTTENVKLTNETLLTWNRNSVYGVIVNAKPFDNMMRFIIREVRTSTSGKSLTFGLINSTNIGFKTPLDMSTCLDFKCDNLIPSPALGSKFSLYKTPYGKVTVKCDNGDPTTLFTVDTTHCFYPIIILDGSVVAIELLPNPSKMTVKQVAGTTASCPQTISASTDECKICMDRTINSAFVPCGHRFACHDCAKEWMRNVDVNCPVCRKKIDILLKTFD